jgi:hypothetical protein
MAAIFHAPRHREVDDNGVPRAGALAYFYESETSTPLTVYEDADLAVPHDNPVVADAGGLFPLIYMATTAYKVVVKTSAGVTLYTADEQAPPVSTSAGALAVAAGGTAATTAAGARTSLGVPSQTAFDTLDDAVSDIEAEIAGYPTFGALADNDKVSLLNEITAGSGLTLLQRSITSISARSSLSGTIPFDTTVPLVEEGDTIFNPNFTPLSASSKIRVRAELNIARASAGALCVALFKASAIGTNAIKAAGFGLIGTGTDPMVCILDHIFDSPGASAFPVIIQAGQRAAGTYYLNGSSTAALWGSMLLSTLVIEEWLTH